MRVCLLFLSFLISVFLQVRGQWIHTNGPISATAVQCIDFSSGTDALSTSCGLYFKSGNDTSWEFSHLSSCKTILPYLDGFLVGNNNGVFKVFLDGTWQSQLLFSGSTTNVIKSKENMLFAGCEMMGLYKSIDEGQNWASSNSGLPIDTGWYPGGYYYYNHVYDILIHESGMYAGTQKGVYFSDDNGSHWNAINQGLPIGKYEHLFSSGGYLYASIDGNLYKTLPDPISWSLAFSGAKINDIAGNETFRMLATESGVYINSNQGTNWVAWNEGLNGFPVLSASMVSDTLLAGTLASGLFYRKYGDPAWQSMNEGIVCSPVGPLECNESMIFAGDFKQIHKTTDGGQNWQILNIQQSVRWLTSIAVNSEMLLASMTCPAWPPENAGIYNSTDFGLNWQLASNLPYYDDPYRLYLYEDELYAWENERLFVSHDFGFSWTDITIPSQFCNNVNAVYHSDGKLFVGTCGELLVSTNGGNTYNEVTNGLPANFDVFDLNGDGDLIVAYANFRIYVSQDGGTSWEERPAWNPNNYCYAIEIYQGNIILSSINSLYLSSNTGNSFVQYPGIDNVIITNLMISGDYIYAGTQNNGVWKRQLTEFPLDVAEIQHKSVISVWPNPTTGLITVTIPETTVQGQRIVIKSSTGQTVINAVLSDPANNIDLSLLNPGFYFITLISDTESKTLKIVKI